MHSFQELFVMKEESCLETIFPFFSLYEYPTVFAIKFCKFSYFKSIGLQVWQSIWDGNLGRVMHWRCKQNQDRKMLSFIKRNSPELHVRRHGNMPTHHCVLNTTPQQTRNSIMFTMVMRGKRCVQRAWITVGLHYVKDKTTATSSHSLGFCWY